MAAVAGSVFMGISGGRDCLRATLKPDIGCKIEGWFQRKGGDLEFAAFGEYPLTID